MSRKAILHCWKDGPPLCVHDPKCDGECPDGMSSTCMRERYHTGDHEWSRDDEISITLGHRGAPPSP